MKAHRFVRQIENNEMSEFETHPILQILCELELGPAHIDIGKLTSNFMENDRGLSPKDYVSKECSEILGRSDSVSHSPSRRGRLWFRSNRQACNPITS